MRTISSEDAAYNLIGRWVACFRFVCFKLVCLEIFFLPGRSYLQKGIENCSSQNDEEIQKCILYKLLKEENLNENSASTLLVDLFLASADTVRRRKAYELNFKLKFQLT